jgi:hypothetical protein
MTQDMMKAAKQIVGFVAITLGAYVWAVVLFLI